MNRIVKGFALFIILIIAISSLIIVESASAQTIPKPSVPEFTLKYVDNSYDVAPKTTSSTDPYTGKVTSTTIQGYHVQNRSVEIIIKNQQFTSYLNENGSRVYLLMTLNLKDISKIGIRFLLMQVTGWNRNFMNHILLASLSFQILNIQ